AIHKASSQTKDFPPRAELRAGLPTHRITIVYASQKRSNLFSKQNLWQSTVTNMTRSTASHSTTSRAVAVLILGAALSSGVLAAPTRSPMTPSSIGARDLQSQSSSDGLGTLSEGELPTLQHGVPRQSGDGLTPFDDSENGEDGANPDISVFGSLEKRVDLLKRGKFSQLFTSGQSNNDPESSTNRLLEDSEVEDPGEVEESGEVGVLEVPLGPRASEKEKVFIELL
ncbi:hypothetical protein C8R42DRAFT_763209, partial [Lentinula raphanica]